METEIKKWCTFGAFHRDYPSFIGFLEKGSETSGMIRYAENQLYPLECWDMNYVVVHESLADAIVFLIKNNSDESINTVKEYSLKFETAKKTVDWKYIENKLKQEKMENELLNGNFATVEGEPFCYITTKWDLRFMKLADLEVAQWSKDTSAKVGAVIVKDRRILSTGYNGLARGINDDVPERHERPEKYEWFVHAEPNAIINAAREGVSTLGADMYLNWYPCHICASYVVQAGIKRLFTDKEPEWEHEKWGTAFIRAKTILEEGGVEVIYMNYEAHRQGVKKECNCGENCKC